MTTFRRGRTALVATLLLVLAACQPMRTDVATRSAMPDAAKAWGDPAFRGSPLPLTMAERTARGLRPAAPHPALERAAQAHADWMARNRRMSHAGAGGTMPFDRIRAAGYPACFGAENVAWGQPDALAVVNAWMKSPGHRRNILDARVVHAASARARAPDGHIYWAMLFAAPC